MKILVTGATGFLGSHVAERLVRDGHQVRALVRRTSRTDFLESLGVELVLASLETGEGLDRAVEGMDAIVHGAGVVKARSPEDFRRGNAEGTRRLLDAAERRAGALRRFVYVSSLAAAGFTDSGRPKTEEDPPTPLTHYGKSKLEGERAVLERADRLAVTAIRPPAIYGPRDTEMYAFFQMVARRVVAFLGSPDNKLSLIYAPDCADAIVTALQHDHPSGRVYFVEDGRQYTQAEFARIVGEALGVRPVPLKVPLGVVRLAALGSELYGRASGRAVMLTRDKLKELVHPNLTCSSARIQRELGWKPRVQLEEGARRTVAWYRSRGML